MGVVERMTGKLLAGLKEQGAYHLHTEAEEKLKEIARIRGVDKAEALADAISLEHGWTRAVANGEHWYCGANPSKARIADRKTDRRLRKNR